MKLKAPGRLLGALFITLMITATSFAQDITVRRVKGNKAIVTFPKDVDLKKGDSLQISGDLLETDTGPQGSRNNVTGIDLSMSSYDTESTVAGSTSSSSSKETEASVFWGKNYETFELGPKITYSAEEDSSSEINSISLGGFIEYNFIPNKPGVKIVPTVGLGAGVGKGEIEASGVTLEANSVYFEYYAAIKFFPLGRDNAIIASFTMQSESLDFSSNALNFEKGKSDVQQTAIAIAAYY